MLKKIGLLFSFFIIFSNIAAKIVESDTIASILAHLKDNQQTLIVFDIDNTLAETYQELGSDQWFSYKFAQEQKTGKSIQEVREAILPLFLEIRLQMPLKLIEESAPALIKSIQHRNIPIIALTAQEPGLAHKTSKELSILGINFSDEFFTVHRDIDHLESNCLYYKGIIFASNNNKGEILLAFLDKTNFKPQHIIFIDDKDKNLVCVEKALEETEIQFTGIRYNRLDEKVSSIDADQAEQQLKSFLESKNKVGSIKLK
jgi:FMN phosphatase YigB (HAD superfamily)